MPPAESAKPPHEPDAPSRPANPADDTAPDTLIARAATGDADAWGELVHRYTRRVYGLILKNCQDPDLAEELTQQTFVKLVQSLDGFTGYDERGKFEPWIFRVAMNGLRDEMRRRKRQASTMDMSPAAAAASTDRAQAWANAQQHVVHDGPRGGPSPHTDPLDQLQHDEQVTLLQQAVETLPDADRELLYLRHTAGLTFPQIAETLGQPLGTVLARGHRAIKKLRVILESQLDTPTPNPA